MPFRAFRATKILFLIGLLGLYLPSTLSAADNPNYSASGTVTKESEAPAEVGFQTTGFYPSATVNYFCTAPSTRPRYTLTVSTISNANPGAMTITSHGFNASVTPLVLISGATGNWTPINGLHVLTYSSSSAMLIDVDTTSFGSFSGQTITVSTQAVRETDEYYAITKIVYDVSGNMIFKGWASGAANASSNGDKLGGGRSQFAFACASRASYGYQ